jgi:hypothetical protein
MKALSLTGSVARISIKTKRYEDGRADDPSEPGRGPLGFRGMEAIFKISGSDTGGAFAVVEHPMDSGRRRRIDDSDRARDQFF